MIKNNFLPAQAENFERFLLVVLDSRAPWRNRTRTTISIYEIENGHPCLYNLMQSCKHERKRVWENLKVYVNISTMHFFFCDEGSTLETLNFAFFSGTRPTFYISIYINTGHSFSISFMKYDYRNMLWCHNRVCIAAINTVTDQAQRL